MFLDFKMANRKIVLNIPSQAKEKLLVMGEKKKKAFLNYVSWF